MRSVCRTLVHAERVRVWLAVLLSLGVLTSCGPDEKVAAAQCRQQFADHRQMLGENGNPGSKDFTPKLTARWDALYAEFERLSAAATDEDCPGKLTTMKRQMKRVEAVLYKIDDYDVARMIKRAESDLEHARKLRPAGAAPDYMLITTFRTLQTSGADARKSLAPYVARVDAVDPDKYADLSDAMVTLYNAAASDAAFADFKDALDTIQNYELDEE
jgi:hypothetical protein